MGMTAPIGGTFTGRDTDLARLAALARTGGAIVRGPAGVGKSVLLRHAAEVIADGRPYAAVEGNEASGAVPFAPFAPMLEAGTGAAPHELASALHDRLAGAALLVVDDAHRLDAASAGLVHRLAAEGTPLLLAVRSGEPVPPAIESLWTRGQLTLHEVLPFDLDATAAFAAAHLGPPVDAGLVHALHQASGGNPLYARELLRAAVDSGAAGRHRGVWVLHSALTADGDLATVLHDQLAAQSEGVRRAVECLAIAEPLALEQLAAIVGAHDLDVAEARGLLRVEDGERPLARLGHPLYRDVALAALSPTRRRRVADALLETAEHPGTHPDPATLAAWRLERGDARPPEEWLDAARRVHATDQRLAEAFIRAAVDTGGGPPALLALANLLTHQHRLEEAAGVFDALAAAPLPPEARTAIAAVEAFLLAMPAQRPDEALALVERVAAAHGSSPDLQASRALALWRAGEVDAAIALARTVADDESAPATARANAVLTIGSADVYALRVTGPEFAADVALMQRLVPLAADVMPEAPESAGLVVTSRVLMPVPDVAAAIELGAENGRRALLRGDDGVRAQYAMLHGWALALAGDLDGALDRLREAYAGRGVWMPTTLPWLRATLVRVLAASGRLAEAREVLAELEASPRAGLYALDAVLARAAVREADGDTAGALALLAAAAGADRAGNRLRGDELWLRRMRLGEDGAASEVARRYGRREGDAAAAIAAHAAAVVSADRARIGQAVGSLASAGLLWDACEAQADLIRRHRAAGDGPSERLAVEWLAALVGGTRSLALPRVATELRPQLTGREREIARLAATLPDRGIAERLGISERTVQTHLTRVYRKLRIAGRGGLAEGLLGLEDV